MKQIKTRMIIEIILLLLGTVGLVLSIIYDNSFAIGFSSSIFGFAIIWLLRLSKISKNENALKDYQNMEKDKRLKLLNHQARSISFTIISFALLITAVIGYYINNDTILFFSTGTVFVGIICYLITYAILSRIK